MSEPSVKRVKRSIPIGCKKVGETVVRIETTLDGTRLRPIDLTIEHTKMEVMVDKVIDLTADSDVETQLDDIETLVDDDEKLEVGLDGLLDGTPEEWIRLFNISDILQDYAADKIKEDFMNNKEKK